uniref:Rapsyn myristoylation/linker region N-terminal domain-containing protein n=1 Tax=Ciona savignyi TaxID=51511 RepID=H2YLP3_CIOSA
MILYVQIKKFPHNMGQMKSKNGGMLSISYDSYYADETFTKMENLLKELTEKPEERDILNRWEHTMNKRFRCSLERWRAFGWAIRVLENWGKHRIVLAFALRQVELAHELEDTNEFPQGVDVNAAILLADSYLNLAKVNLIKSQYKSCEKYSSKCLSLVSTIRRVYTDGLKLSGHAYLYKANANLGLSNFKQTLEDLERSLSVANDQDDKQLECLACGTMSSLYIQLKDYEKGNFFAV